MELSSGDDGFPDQFQRECIKLVASLVPLSSCIFYLVDTSMLDRGAVMVNLDASANRDYQRKYRSLDPLDPARFARSGEKLVCLDDLLCEGELLQSAYYREFMQPLNHRHVADVFLRRDGGIVAVLSVLREAALGRFGSDELGLLLKLQPFLEYALNSVYFPKRTRERQTVQARYKLTDREVDVLEWIIAGASNKMIARELAVGLATVKTHMQHLFAKVKVTSRISLLARARDVIKS